VVNKTKKPMNRMSLDDSIRLSNALRSMTEPARRHKCELCGDVFECHLCVLEENHRIHSEAETLGTALICEACIHRNELFVLAIRTNHAKDQRYSKLARAKNMSSSRGFGKCVIFFDHLTGERIGNGTIRRH
jgi:hypothetical protein